MTSEIEALKTNEFLRRRKLRLQQVREQSKDIAKKIRQRANAEKFRYLVNLDSTKEKDYLEQQEKLIKKLEYLHAQNLGNVGASHRNASQVIQQDNKQEKVDLSKQRARDAAAELRHKKQEKLNEKKRLLDRRLQAREVANEISREKSSIVANKLSKSSVKNTEETETVPEKILTSDRPNAKDNVDVVADMGTQWDSEVLPNEWEPHIPVLSLPKDDSPEKSNIPESQSDRTKKPNLFAVSDEMPSSLRGLADMTDEVLPVKASTLVSEYIQNRDLRLRDYDFSIPSKKPPEDLHSLKQTIMRARASRNEVSAKPNKEKPAKLDNLESSLNRKSSVTMYNHSTRDVKDVPYADKKLVIRDHHSDEDAYSQAMKETCSEKVSKEREHQKKLQEMRHKIAMTKQNVEKEYKDTMAFLKSLPKDKSKPIKNAYKDDQQQQLQKELRQRKLQQEFKKIHKECRKQPNMNTKFTNRSKVQVRDFSDEDFDANDSKYSWMPVPESDGGLAIHIIPTKVREQKSSNAVKFSKIDSYHEYRSRHKHTPPTKDTAEMGKQQNIENGSIDEDDTEISSEIAGDSSSIEDLQVDTDKKAKYSSDRDHRLSDAEKIIIYKILDSKSEKIAKKHSKILKEVAKSLSSMKNRHLASISSGNVAEEINKKEKDKSSNSCSKSGENTLSKISFEQLKEGVYKTVTETGDNVSSKYCKDENASKIESNVGTGPACYTRGQQYKIDRGCGCLSKEVENSDSVAQVPHTDSIASFKTATNDRIIMKENLLDKQQNTNADTKGLIDRPESGYIKIIDDEDHESGKLYIGASGFLKDDKYEVIIQLRKTDEDNKVEIKETPNKSKEDLTSVPLPALEHEEIKVPSNKDVDLNNEKPSSTGEQITSNIDKVDRLSNRGQQSLVDKSVDTPFNDSYAIPIDYPKVNPDVKAANSVSIQTSFDSPESRPLFFRMSSSTSTTYMSPPELILPDFLRHDHEVEYNESKIYYNKTDPRVHLNREHPFEDDSTHYPKKKKITVSKPKQPASTPSPMRQTQRGGNLRTPPNTARSTSSGYSPIKKVTPSKKKISSAISFYRPKKGLKCEERTNSKGCLKRNARKPKLNSLASQRTKKSSSRTCELTLGKFDFNPVIKWYVDKLLMMNREGLKTIEIINQDCSAVTTPGSSIVGDPNNIGKGECNAEAKISLEQITQIIVQQILEKIEVEKATQKPGFVGDMEVNRKKYNNFSIRFPKKRSVHKVKSLNISRSLKKPFLQKPVPYIPTSALASDITSEKLEDCVRSVPTLTTKQRSRSKSSPSPRRTSDNNVQSKTNSSEVINVKDPAKNIKRKEILEHITGPKNSYEEVIKTWEFNPANDFPLQQKVPCVPLNTSTQTSRIIDEEIQYIKLAENKLQNMEKIADLTEKCTKRLSNLAKVLEEVRKNKLPNNPYSPASESASDTDDTSKKKSDDHLPEASYEPVVEIKGKDSVSPRLSNLQLPEPMSPPAPKSPPIPKLLTLTPSKQSKETVKNLSEKKKYVPHLKNIPRSKSPVFPVNNKITQVRSPISASVEQHHCVKSRGKPPPALSRRSLKHAPEYVVPHELSTVLEVDSPISSKLRSQTARNDNNYEAPNESSLIGISQENIPVTEEQNNNDPDILQTNQFKEVKMSAISTFDDSKIQMMDLRKFNEIMLKPFISIQEYAKQCNVETLEEGSNLENIPKDDVINDELSSLHSDGSLPDVIAELLKRNIISEPFKFDTGSNVNSTTCSSDSTLSVLALSKMKKEKKKTNDLFSNKENVVETSDTLSISSNPDLENAFKKLGMGWASSTLKKTKEHLAFSSSSNTSSSSLSQFRLNNINNKDFPALVTDSMSSIRNASHISGRCGCDSVKEAGQQTSKVTSMTVKQFLTDELAKRITFDQKLHEDDTVEEFVSLCETKIPEEMKQTSKFREDRSFDSNTRARTSTPVQLFKSLAYHSSSSSNLSNGLFSNADELSSVKGTSNSIRNHSTSEKDDLTIPNFNLRTRKGMSDNSNE